MQQLESGRPAISGFQHVVIADGVADVNGSSTFLQVTSANEPSCLSNDRSGERTNGRNWPIVPVRDGYLIETELDSTSHLNRGVRLMDLIGQLMKENLGLALLAVCCLATVTWNSWPMGQTAHTISAKP